jgi:FKBP-type peptidyl-prolyl cis-trans isomerase FkpA
MKQSILSIVIGILALAIGYFAGVFYPVSGISGTPDLKTDVDTFAYGIGLDMGMVIIENSEQLNILDDFNKKLFLAGINNGMKQDESKLGRMEAQMSIQQFIMGKREEMQAKSEVDAVDNLQKGQQFLADNGKREGVITTESGLQYEVLSEGEGIVPEMGDTVVVHYIGSLIDGTVFQSSKEMGEPATFNVGQVIPGWNEGLQLMKTGSTYKFYIPSDLAYGSAQRGEDIKPNSTLIFEVELIDVRKK